MSSNATFYASRIAWNGITWSAAGGESLRLEYRLGGEVRAERPAGLPYPTFVSVARPGCLARVTLRELQPDVALGAKSDLVATLKTRTGQDTLTLRNMVLIAVGGAQDGAQAGGSVLTFAHESADGQISPLG